VNRSRIQINPNYPRNGTVADLVWGGMLHSERERIAQSPPDILLTNLMMLELILTRFEPIDRRVVENRRGLEFLLLDELYTCRGRQGADVAMLVRRLRQPLSDEHLPCISAEPNPPAPGAIA
jgi:ATP-dependent helicase YprA (DUF1998 family)